MRRAQRLLCHAGKPNAYCGGTFKGTRSYSSRSGFMAPFQKAYNASQTVLDLDAADNEHVVPIRRVGGVNKTLPPDIASLSTKQWSLKISQDAEESIATPVDYHEAVRLMCQTEAGARWVSENPDAFLRKFLVIRTRGHTEYKQFMAIINDTIDRLEAFDLPMGLGLCAVALRQVSWAHTRDHKLYLRQAGRLFGEVQARGYSMDVKEIDAKTIELWLVGDDRGINTKRHFITRHAEGIRNLLYLTTPLRNCANMMDPPVKACLRDLIESENQYMKYLDMLFTMGSHARGALRNEWTMEYENGRLSKPSFDISVELIARFLPNYPTKAAEVIKTWAAGEGATVFDFLFRFNGTGEVEKLAKKGHWEHSPLVLKAGVNALVPEIPRLPELVKVAGSLLPERSKKAEEWDGVFEISALRNIVKPAMWKATESEQQSKASLSANIGA